MTTSFRTITEGPKGGLFVGCANEFVHDPLGFLDRIRHDFGNVVSLKTGPLPVVVINEPEVIEEVLVT